MKKNKIFLLVFFLSLAVSAVVFNFLLPKAKPFISATNSNQTKIIDDDFSIIALGDSLTEGIGDEVNNSGYLPIVKKNLERWADTSNIETYNYGLKGNRTKQLIKRIEEDESLKEDLKNANIILITIGGNDLIKVLKDNLFGDFSLDSIDDAMETFLSELELLYHTIRNYNENATIYQLGIYNPFYLNFPDITQLQEIVDLWNSSTKNYVFSQDKSFFIDINDLIYQGDDFSIENQPLNTFLSKDDSFHPNYLGYQLIASEFTSKIIDTYDIWGGGD